MTALRFAVFGKNRLAAARCKAIAAHAGTQIRSTWSTDQAAALSRHDWNGILDSREIDAIILALPSGLALETSIAALRAGIHVLTELPGGRTVEDIINLREAERASHAVLKFGCGLRYHESVQAALRLTEENAFGRLLTARAVYGHAGYPAGDAADLGILFGHGLHMIDLLHLFCGPFETVKAMCAPDQGTAANVFAILRSGAGAIVQLHSSATSWRQTFRLELGFEEGYVWLEGHVPGPEGYGPEMLIHARVSHDATGTPLANPSETVSEFTSPNAVEEELAEFVDAMAGRAGLRHGTSNHAFDAINIAQRICAAFETWA